MMNDDDDPESRPSLTPPSTAAAGWRQVGALVLHDSGTVSALRWVPRDREAIRWCGGTTLVYHVPDKSLPFVSEALRRTAEEAVDVEVYSCLRGPVYRHLGLFRVTAWRSPCATFHRQTPLPPVEAVPPPPPPPPPPPVPAVLTILDVLRAWSVDVGDEGVRFPMPPSDDAFVPDAVLYRALSPTTVAWCGPARGRRRAARCPGEPNRLGDACLCCTFSDYPEDHAFQQARRVVRHYRMPLLLLFGVPGDVRDRRRNAALQAILFRPATGDTTRAHFRWGSDDGTPPRLVAGEIGDPLA